MEEEPRLENLTLDELDVIKMLFFEWFHFHKEDIHNGDMKAFVEAMPDRWAAMQTLYYEAKRCYKAKLHGVPASQIPLGQETIRDSKSDYEADDWG